MASTDARPIPIKNTAYRVYLPILDADGDLVAGATGLDSEISKDGGTFTDCTNEATEIATSSGMYYLDLSSTEMNADAVCIIVKTSSSGAKTTPIVLYPCETGDIDVDVTAWNGTAVSSPATAGIPEVNVKNINNVAATSVTTVNANIGTTQPTNYTGTGASALVKSDMVDIAGAAVSTSSAQIGVNAVSVANNAITAAAIATDAIDNDAIAANAVSKIQSGLSTLDAAGVRTAVGLASANLDTQLDALPTADENADALLDRTAGVETNRTLRQALRLMLAALGGKLSGAATTTVTIRDTNDSVNRITATVDADGNRSAVTYDAS